MRENGQIWAVDIGAFDMGPDGSVLLVERIARVPVA